MLKKLVSCFLILLCLALGVALAEGELDQAYSSDFEGYWVITAAMDDQGGALDLEACGLDGTLALFHGGGAFLYQHGTACFGTWSQVNDTAEAEISLEHPYKLRLHLTEDGAQIPLIGGSVTLTRGEAAQIPSVVHTPKEVMPGNSDFVRAIEKVEDLLPKFESDLERAFEAIRQKRGSQELERMKPDPAANCSDDEAHLELSPDGSFLLTSYNYKVFLRVYSSLSSWEYPGWWACLDDTLYLQFTDEDGRPKESYACSYQLADGSATLSSVQRLGDLSGSRLMLTGIWADVDFFGSDTSVEYKWKYTLNLDGTASFDDGSGTDQEGYTWAPAGAGVQVMDASGAVVEELTSGYQEGMTTLYESSGQNGDIAPSTGKWWNIEDGYSVNVWLEESGRCNVMLAIPLNDWEYENWDDEGQWVAVDGGVRLDMRKGSVNLPYVGGHFIYTMPDGKEITLRNDTASTREGNYTYNLLEDGTIQISGSGLAAQLDIPAEIDGYRVTSIASGAFSGWEELESVTIPEGVTKLEPELFANCKNLTSVVLPSTLSCIGARVFLNCKKLASVTLPQGLTEIQEAAFDGCWGMQHIQLPEGLKIIGDGAFRNCSLNEIVLPSGLSELGVEAFCNCKSLKEAEININIEKIPEGLFQGCYGLHQIAIPQGVTDIGDNAFNGSNVNHLQLPEGLIRIGNNAFYGCYMFELTFPESLQEIGNGAFYQCPLMDVVLGENVTRIGDEAFASCKAMETITIPASAVELGADIFKDCDDWSDFSPLTLRVEKGSAAEEYARNNGLTYVYMDGSEPDSQAARPTVAPEPTAAEPTAAEPTPAAGPDDEASLWQAVAGAAGADPIAFFCADYDGDGAQEAFAFVGTLDDSFGYASYKGDLWFVNAGGAQPVQQGNEYDILEMLGNPPTMIFHAEEYHGGSGSVSYTWIVENGAPKTASVPESGDLEWAGGNDYYGYPDAFDMDDDGTGHTWKRYYFFMDGGTLKEYGGITISQDELLEFNGAKELLQGKIDEGYSIGDIIYRENGVINVNLDRGSENANLSLRYDETSVSYWEENGGVYLTASDPSIAVYPAEFRHPDTTDEPPVPLPVPTAKPAPTAEPAPIVDLPAVDGGYSCEFDLDGDGAAESILLYKIPGVDDYGNQAECIRLRVTGADGSVQADGEIHNYVEWQGPERHYWLYSLGGGRIYVNAEERFEGASNNYKVLRMEGGSLVEEINLCDPDQSDGVSLFDENSWEDVYYSDWYADRAGPAYLEALNQRFAAFGVTFAADGNYARADLPDSQLICDVTEEQIGGSGGYIVDVPVPQPIPTDGPTAYAYTTGDVNMRSGPSLNDGSVGIVPGGSEVEYLGEESVDDRGVTWYRIRYSGMEGWGSSKYVKLE